MSQLGETYVSPFSIPGSNTALTLNLTLKLTLTQTKGPFKCYVTLFFGKLDAHPPPRNANNIEHYNFVTLFPENMTAHPHRRYVTLE